MSWTAGVRFPTWVSFSLLHNVQAGSVAHSVFYQIATRSKAREAYDSPLSAAEVKISEIITPPPHMFSERDAKLIKAHRLICLLPTALCFQKQITLFVLCAKCTK
jgi:hypothetical protein